LQAFITTFSQAAALEKAFISTIDYISGEQVLERSPSGNVIRAIKSRVRVGGENRQRG